MDSYRTLVVVNPHSAGGSTARRWERIAAELNQTLSEWEHAVTSGPGDATHLSRKALQEGYEMVVAVGGDGTINEVVNGFYEAGETVVASPVLGLIPSGSGGDYRKTWGFSRDVTEAVGRLAGRKTRVADAGRVVWRPAAGGDERVHYFANIASFGLSAEVCTLVDRSTKPFGGKVTFFTASARAMMSYKRQPVRLVIDEGEPQDVLLTTGACCIGRYFGGGMMGGGTEADPSDGQFEVVSLELGRIDLIRMRSIYKGQHFSHPKVSHWQGKSVKATSTGDLPVHIEADGELVGTALPARFDVLPGAFRVKV